MKHASFAIFIPFHNPWQWHTDYANQTARLLSRTHVAFCFLWGDAVSLKEILTGRKQYQPLRKHDRLFLYQPLYIIPGKRLPTSQSINLFLNLISAYIICSLIAIRSKLTLLFWCFGIYDPAFLLLPPFFRHTRTVYDCVDIPSHPDPAMTKRLIDAEASLLKHAWLVTTNSATLHARLKHIRENTRRIPLGFREEIFRRPLKHTLPFPESLPVIGYIGAIDYRLNIRLLIQLVTKHPQWKFALIGPVFYDHLHKQHIHMLTQLLKYPNVYHTVVPPRHIPDILRQCRVTIIPYRSSLDFNRYAFPMKIMEYFYAGKSVISCPIEELKEYPELVTFASTPRQWEQALGQKLARPLSSSRKRQARRIAKSHTWHKKITALLLLLREEAYPRPLRP